MGLIDWVGSLIDPAASKNYDTYKGQLQDIMNARPTYVPPSSEQEYLQTAKSNLNSLMPQYDEMASDINTSLNTGINTSKQQSNSSSGALGAAASLYNKSMQSRNTMDILQSQYKDKMTDKYSQALLTDADYQDKAWNWNVGQKYGEQYNYLQSQIQSAEEDKRTANSNAYRIAGL